MKNVLISFILIATFYVFGCSSDEDMSPEEDVVAEIPEEFQQNTDGRSLSAKGELSGKIGNEPFKADLKSVSFTDIQDIPGYTTQTVELVGMALEPDQNEMVFISLISYDNEIKIGVDYKDTGNATVVGLYVVGKDNYRSSLINQVEFRFQKLDFETGLASGSLKGSLLGFTGESGLPSSTLEISFENIELVKVGE